MLVSEIVKLEFVARLNGPNVDGTSIPIPVLFRSLETETPGPVIENFGFGKSPESYTWIVYEPAGIVVPDEMTTPESVFTCSEFVV